MAITFDDLEKLPDDVQYELPDGTKVSLGDIRGAAKEHVNKRIAELTPREQKLAAREKALEAESQQVREAMVALANQPAAPAPPPVAPGEFIPLNYTPDQWAQIKNDPYSRPIVEALAAMAQKIHENDKRMTEREAENSRKEAERRQAEEAGWINYQFEKLAADDPDYQNPEKRKELLDYAREVLTRRDISVIHKARRFDDAVKRADDLGYQRGLKEGSAKAPIPSVPYSTKAAPVPPALEKLPASFNEFSDAAAADADLIQEIRQAAASPTPQQ